jgi:hypothetical protein
VSGRRDPISFEIHSERKLPMASFLSVNTTGRNAMDWMEYFVEPLFTRLCAILLDSSGSNFSSNLAERTGLEPATPGVTGRYSNQLNYRSRFLHR